MVEQTLHLLGVIPPSGNRRHLINAPIEVIGKIEHLNPCEMHEEFDMVGVDPGVSPLTGEVLHDNHH